MRRSRPSRIVLLSILSAASAVAAAILQRELAADTFAGADPLPVAAVSGVVLALVLAAAFLEGARRICVQLGLQVQRALVARLTAHLTGLKAPQARQLDASFLNVAFSSDLTLVAQLFEDAIPGLLTGLAPLLAVPFVLTSLGGTSWAAAAIGLVLVVAVCVGLGLRHHRLLRALRSAGERRAAAIDECLGGNDQARVLGWLAIVHARAQAAIRDEAAVRVRLADNGNLMNLASQFAPQLLLSVVLITSYTAQRGPDDASRIAALFALSWLLAVFLVRPLRNVPVAVAMCLDALVSLERLNRLGSIEPSLPFTPQYAAALRDVELAPGQLASVSGGPQSGKTTFLEALVGQWDQGDRRGVSHELWRSAARPRIVFLPDEPVFVPGSVRRNLVLFCDDEPAGSAVQGALDATGLSAEGVALDLALNASGEPLSGGQRQRLALARALLAAPEVLVMDNPFSELDLGRRARMNALLRALQDRGARVVMATASGEEFDAGALRILCTADRGIELHHGAGS